MKMYLRKILHPISTTFGCLAIFRFPKIEKKNGVFSGSDFSAKNSNLKTSKKIPSL
jgi:hypothetical protein